MADLFNIGISALLTTQRQLSTTSHNIANVYTDGYSRQRAELTQISGHTTAGLFVGDGVRVSEVNRIADKFLINQLRSANANEAKASAYVDFASRIDNLLGNGAFSSAVDGFFSSVQDANGGPASLATREVLLHSAESLAARFSDLDQRLSATARDLNGEIKAAVERVNTLSSAIADINRDIVRAIGIGRGAAPNDLLDQRDQLLADLSKLVGVEAIEQDNGALNVVIGSGQLIVAGTANLPLVTVPNPLDGTRLEVATSSAGSTSIVSPLINNGELGAALEFRDDLLDPTRNEIGRLAAALAISFNEQHHEGFDLNDNFGLDLFSIGAPQVNADPTNTGAITVTLDTTNVASLTAADYRLSHDGVDFTLLNLVDGTAQTLAGAGPFNVDGLTISLTAAPAAGDVYLIQPTKSIARNMSVTISNVREVALARPNRTSADLANIGDATISAPTVLDISDPSLVLPTQLVFNDPPTTFQVGGIGPLIPYTSGSDIDMNGWRVQVSGSPEPGDVFKIDPNVGGAGDNANGLLLANLQLTKIIDNTTATYQESYSQLVGTVGSKTLQTQLSRDALRVLQENAKASRDSLSAVNLDEEAAQLLRFQQAYAAAAEVISIANNVFDTLLAAVRR